MLGYVLLEYHRDKIYILKAYMAAVIKIWDGSFVSFGYSNINKIFWLRYDSCCPVESKPLTPPAICALIVLKGFLIIYLFRSYFKVSK